MFNLVCLETNRMVSQLLMLYIIKLMQYFFKKKTGLGPFSNFRSSSISVCI